MGCIQIDQRKILRKNFERNFERANNDTSEWLVRLLAPYLIGMKYEGEVKHLMAGITLMRVEDARMGQRREMGRVIE